jgi:hypothetical protein
MDDARKNSSNNRSGGANSNHHHQWAFGWIVKFILYHKARYERKEITGGTLRNYYKPLRVFCEANDIAIGWLKITRGLPKPRKFAQDRAPTNDEICKVMTYPDRRIKPIVLVMSSSGIRVGAWDYLRWGHIEPIFRDEGKLVVAAKMRVYAGEAEEYNTFITPEAYAAVKEWMDFRAEYGEKITANSWVMRDMFTTATLTWESNRGMASAPVQLKSSGIRTMLKRAWISQGLMKDKEGGATTIYEFKSSHGFRKRFKTQCELAGVKPLNVECMLGHDTGIAGSSYYRPSDAELCEDYLKAVDVLTIGKENRLRERLLQEEKKSQSGVRQIELRHQQEMEAVRQEMEKKFQMILEKIDFNRLL